MFGDRKTDPQPFKQVRTTLLIPCYNEVKGIPQLCQRLREVSSVLRQDGPLEILFVDDGSTDCTADAIQRESRELPVRIVTHVTNRGLGAALKTGFAECRGQEIVTLDSDCTYDPLQAVEILRILRQGNDVVTASPYHPKGEVVNVQRWRLFISKMLSYMYWLAVPVHLYTYTSCFRAYRRSALNDLHAKDNGFLAVTQLLVSAILQGWVVVEMPARLTSRRFGRSKIRIIPVAISHLRYLCSVIWMQIVGDQEYVHTEEPAPVRQTAKVR